MVDVLSLASLLIQSSASLSDWITTISLVFGGCCSNAYALELVTSENPSAGSLITLAQFILVSLYGLRRHIEFAYHPVMMAKEELLKMVIAEILRIHSVKLNKSREPSRKEMQSDSRRPQINSEMSQIQIHQGTPQNHVESRKLYTSNRSEKRLTETQRRNLSDYCVYVLLQGSGAEAFGTEIRNTLKLEQVATSQFSLERSSVEDNGNGNDEFDLRNFNGTPADVVVVVLVDREGQEDTKGRSHMIRTHPWRWDYSVSFPDGRKPSESTLSVDTSSPSHLVILQELPTSWLGGLTRLRLKPRSIPLSRYSIQVLLFFLTSLLNNAAFGYDVPMAVHIIFRSGGLVVNMLLGWFIDGRRYNMMQTLSIVLVSLGVVCTTLSASSVRSASSYSSGSYSMGIMILTLALFMSGFMGLAQDRAYTKYGRGHWQEAMFYLHFLSLPGFAFVWRDLVEQIQTVHASRRIEVNMGLRHQIAIPSFYAPLLLNVVTQLVCVSGVHRLTAQVNSLTVTLVLVVRKAVSLGISVVLVKGQGGFLLWTGAGLVLTGTVGYTLGSRPTGTSPKARE